MATFTTAVPVPAPSTAADATLGEHLRARYGAVPTGLAGAGDAPVNAVLATQLQHRTVRTFLPDEVDDLTLHTLVAAAQSAPSSSNTQSWSVVAVRDPARRARFAELAGGQQHIAQAPLLLVWVADYARARLVTGVDLGAVDYLDATVVGIVDAAVAAQNAVVAAASLGLGTVYIGGLRNHPDAVAAELGLPDGTFAVVGLVVGHPDPAGGEQVKPRLGQEAVLHHDRYDLSGQAEAVERYERHIGDFYAREGLVGTWTDRLVGRLGSVDALHGRDRLRPVLEARGLPSR